MVEGMAERSEGADYRNTTTLSMPQNSTDPDMRTLIGVMSRYSIKDIPKPSRVIFTNFSVQFWGINEITEGIVPLLVPPSLLGQPVS